MKLKNLFCFFAWGMIVLPLSVYADQEPYALGANAESFSKILAQGKIINEGHLYLRSLQFEAALIKYATALNPEFSTSSNDGFYFPTALKALCLQYQGKYDEALQVNQWYFEQDIFKNVRIEYPVKPLPIKKSTVKDTVVDREIKLRALKEWKRSGNAQPVYDYIDYMKSKYLYWLPPKRTDTLKFSNIAELYDLLGDYDAGIVWAKSFQKATKDKRYKQEYGNVIKAFEESKQGLPKICGDEGRTCVGRATAYIIQSDQL